MWIVCERQLEMYWTPSRRCPFDEWYRSLNDKRAGDKVKARISRLRSGNPGDFRTIGAGLFEMRIDYGPGYRVYFGLLSNNILILLYGGNKKTQTEDIRNVRQYWEEAKNG